jgi:dipeptidyl aminopeptidase/acylaminoacyl peptidase
MTDFDFDRFLALPRLSSLRLSPDGRRLVVAVGGPDAEGKKMRSALWQVDPAGAAPPRRLTRSAAGEAGGAAFLPDGSLLFTSSRPDPDVKPDPERTMHALWLLPAEGGEARLLAAPEGGIDGVCAAREAGRL